MMIPLTYNGNGSFQAPRGFIRRCDEALVLGEAMPWEIVNPRSAKSHKHYFATITEAWSNLPDDITARLPSPEHLRKWALIKSGHCTVSSVSCLDAHQAALLAAVLTQADTYAVIEVEGSVVTIYRAESQSFRNAKSPEFQKQKDDVFGVIGRLIGIDPVELGKAA